MEIRLKNWLFSFAILLEHLLKTSKIKVIPAYTSYCPKHLSQCHSFRADLPTFADNIFDIW